MEFDDQWMRMIDEYLEENEIEIYSKEELNKIMNERMKILKMNQTMLKLNYEIISLNISKLCLFKNVLDVDSEVIKLYGELNHLNETIVKVAAKIVLKDTIL